MKNKHLAFILVVEFLITVILTVGFINLTNNNSANQTHLALYEEITAIKNRLTINITEIRFY